MMDDMHASKIYLTMAAEANALPVGSIGSVHSTSFKLLMSSSPHIYQRFILTCSVLKLCLPGSECLQKALQEWTC